MCVVGLVLEVNENGAKTEAVEAKGVVVAIVCVLGLEMGQASVADAEGSLLPFLEVSALDALEYILFESVVAWIVLEY